MKKISVWIVAIACIVGGVWLVIRETSTPIDTQDSVRTYSNETYKLTFDYPTSLYLKERVVETPERAQLAVVLVEDTQENRDVIEGRSTDPREGPTSITVDVYQNEKSLTAQEWVAQDATWPLATSELSDVIVAGKDGVTYNWSGLYEGTSLVFTEGTYVYVFSVTRMTPEDALLANFDSILASASFGTN